VKDGFAVASLVVMFQELFFVVLEVMPHFLPDGYCFGLVSAAFLERNIENFE